jgi:uncharacterized protein YhaN
VFGLIIGLIVGLAVAGIWLSFIKKIAGADKRTLERTIEKLQKEIDGIDREMSDISKTLSPILESHTPEETLTKWGEYEKLMGELDGLRQLIEHNESLDKIQTEYEGAQANLYGVQKETKQLFDEHPALQQFRDKPIELDNEVGRLESECDGLEDRLGKLQQEKDELKLEWARLVGSGVDDLETLDTEIKASEQQLTDYKRQRDALVLAEECLQEAIDSIKDEHKGVIEGRLDTLFGGWTGHPDRQVMLDDLWNPLIKHKLKSDVSPDELSRGTMDQLYLAYRVALSEAMSREVPLPFLLDDPFVHFDPERRKLARKAFEAISETHQVILFTQDPGFKDWGKLVELT